MIPMQSHARLSDEVTKIEFRKVANLFNSLNINLFHLSHYPNSLLTINNDISIESDNNLWGQISNLCSIGAFSYHGSNDLGFGVSIGRYCSIAINVKIMGAEHFVDWISTSPIFYEQGYHDIDATFITNKHRSKRRVNIGNDVWIGRDVVLKADINIGDGAIIASNSVVTKDVPPYAVVGGVPAKIIKYRFDDNLIEKQMQLRWWRFHKDDLKGLLANKPKYFLYELEERISLGKIEEYRPKIFNKADIVAYANQYEG